MKAGIYARISEDRDEMQLGVSRQLADCEQLVAQRGWSIEDRYVDNDVSAYRGGRRPEYRRMLDDVAARRLDAVVVYHQDRLHRQPRELEEFFDVCDAAGVTELASVSGDIDLGSDDGRFKARILGAVARKESDDKSRRIRRKMDELARAGAVKGGGTRPFGFEEDRVTIRRSEARVIKELAGRFVAGAPLRSLCRDLEQRGIKTPTGRVWQPLPLSRMLRSARISGQREHRGEIVARAQWPAIIRPEQTSQIRAILADPSRRATRPPRSYLLKGLLRCGRCGGRLVSRPRDDGSRRYVCARDPGGCGKTFVLAEPLEEFVTEAVLWRLDSPDLANAIRGAQDGAASEWQARADALTVKLDELAELYASEAITVREWMAARDPLQAQLVQARRQISHSTNMGAIGEHAGRGGELRDRWPELDVERRHAVIAAVLAHATVGPGKRGYNRFDPDRFGLVWRY